MRPKAAIAIPASIVILCFIAFSVSAAGKIQIMNYSQFNEIKHIKTLKNHVWIATGGGLIHLNKGDNSVQCFQMKDGLPSHQVNGIEFDSDENLWIATQHGVACLKGQDWQIFKTDNGLASNQISCVARDRKGKLWFGTDKGLCTRIDTTWTSYNVENAGLAGDQINQLTFDQANHLWIATNGGLTEYFNNRWINHGFRSHLKIYAIAAQDSAHIFISYDGGIFFRDNSKWLSIDQKKGFITRLSPALLACPNKVYIGTIDGIDVFENGVISKTIKGDDFGINDYIRCLYIDEASQIWAGTQNGVYTIQKEKDWTPIKIPFKPCPRNIRALFSGDSVIWAGSSEGMYQLTQNCFVQMHWTDGDTIKQVNLIKRIDGESFYFSTNHFIGKMSHGKLEKVVNLTASPLGTALICLYIGRDGLLWCGSAKGAAKLRGTAWEEIKSGVRINDIIENDDGAILLATPDGLLEIKGAKTSTALYMKELYCFLKDSEGMLWAGGLGVLAYYKRSWRLMDKDRNYNGFTVKSMVQIPSGKIYGICDKTIFTFDGEDKFGEIDQSQGLLDGQKLVLTIDPKNKIWIGGDKGMSVLTP